ncbi:MAG: O-antigen ligase family protein [Labilithrix sp.]|nr:O-antigen ligase family protein [Labilithrix sp.]
MTRAAGVAILVAIACARVDARSMTSAHAHVFLAQELVLVLGAAALAGLAWLPGLAVRRDAVSAVVVGLVALELVSAACAPDRWLALRSATVWISGLVVFLVARASGPGARDRGLFAIVLPLGLVAASVILEALGVVALSAPGHAPGGLLGERNVAAELLVAGAPVVVYACAVEGAASRRHVALGVAALSGCAVVLGRTRSAWLAGLCLLVAFALVGLRAGGARSAGRRRARLAAAAIVLGAVVALALPTTLRWKSARPYHDTLVHLVDPSAGSGAGRLVQYATTLRMAAAHPVLGVGPGNWAPQYLSFARRDDRTVHEGLTPVNRLPNSDVLGFAAERGLVATALLAALAWLLFRERSSPTRAALRRATLLGVVVMASLDAVLQTPAALFLVAWVLGLSSSPPEAEPAVARRPAFAFALVALAAAAVPAARRVASLEVAAHARGAEDFDRAARLDPGDVALHLVAAESWIAESRCDRARIHLDAVAKSSPASPARAELEARCAPRHAGAWNGPVISNVVPPFGPRWELK